MVCWKGCWGRLIRTVEWMALRKCWMQRICPRNYSYARLLPSQSSKEFSITSPPRGAGRVSEVACLPSSLLILKEPRSAFCRIWLPISVWRMDRSLSRNSLPQVNTKLYERQRGEPRGLCTVSGLLGSSITQGLAFPLAFAIGTCQTSNHICVCVEIPPSKE